MDKLCTICAKTFAAYRDTSTTCSIKCRKEQKRRWLVNNKHWSRWKYLRRRHWVNYIKLKFGCQLCGYNKCSAALDFDHLDLHTKEYNISAVVSTGLSLSKLIEEIRKCRLLCANCHREHTYLQNHTRHRNNNDPKR